MRFSLSLALITTCCLAIVPAVASPQDETPNESDRKVLIADIEFPGGTMGQYADLLREEFPDASIVLMPGTPEFHVPRIEARINTLSVAGLFNALSLACDVQGTLLFKDPDTGATRREQGILEVEPIGGITADGLYRILPHTMASQTRGRATKAVEGSAVEVFPVADLLASGITMQELLDTIKVSFEVLEADDPNAGRPPMIRYHEPTAILFVKGSGSQIRLVHETFAALESVSETRQMNMAETNTISLLRQEIVKLKASIEAGNQAAEE